MENKFTKLVEIIEKLRSPQGCPWDKAQTPQSLVEHFEEEVGELKDAIKNQDTENFKEGLVYSCVEIESTPYSLSVCEAVILFATSFCINKVMLVIFSLNSRSLNKRGVVMLYGIFATTLKLPSMSLKGYFRASASMISTLLCIERISRSFPISFLSISMAMTRLA